MRGRQHFARPAEWWDRSSAARADIDIAAVLARDLEPVDEFVVDLAGLQRVQHLHPGRQDELGAPVQPARRRFEARARGRSPARCALVVHLSCAARRARRSSGVGDALQRRAHSSRAAAQHVLAERLRSRLPANRTRRGRRCGRGHGDRQAARNTSPGPRGPPPCSRDIQPSPASAPPPAPLRPARACASSSSAIRSFSRSSRPRMRRAGAAFRSADPAAQLRHLAAREQRGEAAVGGVEQMMAFVEDIAQRAAPAACRWSRRWPASRCAACAITSA